MEKKSKVRIKVVILFFKILRDSHIEIFNLKRLNSLYDLDILDLTNISSGKTTFEDKWLKNKVITIKKFDDLKPYRDNVPSDIIYLCNHGYLSNDNLQIIEILKEDNDKLISFDTRTFICNTDRTERLKIIINSLLRVFLIRSVVSSLLIRRTTILPDYFLTSTKYLIPIQILLNLKKENIFITHCDDYNHILQLNKIGNIRENIAYVDQLLPFALLKDLTEKEKFRYYEQILNALLALKNKLNLKNIDFCLHPEYHVYGDYFEKIKLRFPSINFIAGDTIRIIKDCSIVCGQYSTALGVAVYFNKPIILISNQYIRKNHRASNMINKIRDALNVDRIEVDSEELFLKEKRIYKINRKKYLKYLMIFFKDSSIKENSYEFAIKKVMSRIND